MKKLTFIIILVFGIVQVSCNKDETNSKAVFKKNTDLLTGHKWKLTEYTTNPGVDIEGLGKEYVTDFFKYFYNGECALSNSLEFKPDDTFIDVDSCFYGFGGTTTWSLSSDGTLLSYGYISNFRIVDLDKSVLTVKKEEINDEDGLKYTIIKSYLALE